MNHRANDTGWWQHQRQRWNTLEQDVQSALGFQDNLGLIWSVVEVLAQHHDLQAALLDTASYSKVRIAYLKNPCLVRQFRQHVWLKIVPVVDPSVPKQ